MIAMAKMFQNKVKQGLTHKKTAIYCVPTPRLHLESRITLKQGCLPCDNEINGLGNCNINRHQNMYNNKVMYETALHHII